MGGDQPVDMAESMVPTIVEARTLFASLPMGLTDKIRDGSRCRLLVSVCPQSEEDIKCQSPTKELAPNGSFKKNPLTMPMTSQSSSNRSTPGTSSNIESTTMTNRMNGNFH